MKSYVQLLDLKETEVAIKEIKDLFEEDLAKKLNLTRISAPLFLKSSSGLNDNLNGVERPVNFQAKNIEEHIEIIHSLAKWKRMALKRYNFNTGEGLYTDMNAIRRDEDLDNLHSIYVDQWDWEKIINKEDRTKANLKNIVKDIYDVFKTVEKHICDLHNEIEPLLPKDIYFITTQELEDMYPGFTPKERENLITKEKGAIFLMQIGDLLKSGEKHDGRSPDYDDWSLNGDILFWYPILNCSLEMSSMGIRVDEKTLLHQLEKSNCLERKDFEFHKMLLEGDLPYTVGGGIGQSRICMFFLKKAHIGEVQASLWDEKTYDYCKSHNIVLL